MDHQFGGNFLTAPTAETAKQVWETLSGINVNDHVERKQGYSYLSWAWAWGVLMSHYPDAKFNFERFDDGSEFFRYPDGSGEVRCVMSVAGIVRTMWLPVMDHRNNAIKNPNARDINDAKMRCLVKAMALYGLGHYIYAGEDLPDANKHQAPAQELKPLPASAISVPAIQNAQHPAQPLIDAMNNAKTLDELKSAFTKASKYARNRNDKPLLDELTAAKDKRKKELAA